MILEKCNFFHFLDLLADIGHVQRSKISAKIHRLQAILTVGLKSEGVHAYNVNRRNLPNKRPIILISCWDSI